MPEETQPTSEIHHNIDQIWESIKVLQTGQANNAATTAELGGKMDGVAIALVELKQQVHRILAKPSKEFDWKGLIMIAMSIIAMSGALIAATIAPIHKTVAKHDRQIMRELEESAAHRYNAGKRDGKLDSMEIVISEFIKDSQQRLLTVEARSVSSDATQEIMREWLRARSPEGDCP